MRATGVNRFASYALLFLAVVPVVVLAGAILQGHQPPQEDEGTAAHLFQIAVGLQLPVGLFYAATADWSQASRSIRPLAFAAVMLVLAFSALYYFEHAYHL